MKKIKINLGDFVDLKRFNDKLQYLPDDFTEVEDIEYRIALMKKESMGEDVSKIISIDEEPKEDDINEHIIKDNINTASIDLPFE